MNVVGYNNVFVENPKEGKNELKTVPIITAEFLDINFQKAFVQLMVDSYAQFKKRNKEHIVPEGMKMSTKDGRKPGVLTPPRCSGKPCPHTE